MLNEPPWRESIAWWATVPHCLPRGIVVGPDGAKLYVTLAHTLHTMRGSTARSPAGMLREGTQSNRAKAGVRFIGNAKVPHSTRNDWDGSMVV
jgi:DNA-binding beta-propeller fold protein YncE